MDAAKVLEKLFGGGKGTRCDIDRTHLAVLFGELGLKTGAEIGVQEGKFSEILCKNNPDIHLACIDMWGLRGDKGASWYDEAKKRLNGYGAIFIDKPSIEAAREVPDRSLDFVYIDASHLFDDVMVDIIMWAKKVKIGGIVAGHDYMKFSNNLKKQWLPLIYAVQAYTAAHFIKNWYLTTDDPASYFWVKEFEQATTYDD